MTSNNRANPSPELSAHRAGGVAYDVIAGQYDLRYRSAAFQGVRTLLHEVRDRAEGRALEVGCGTGHWLPLLADRAAGEAVGLDLSRGMLDAARKKRTAPLLCQGEAVALPFASRQFGLTVCANALHHFLEPRRFFLEARRLSSAGGLVLIVGLDAHDPEADWYIYDFFDGVRSMDEDRYPRWEAVRAWTRSAGMKLRETGLAHAIRDELRGEQVFTDPFLARQGTSQLALLSDEDYRLGVERIRRKVRQGGTDGGPALFQTRLDLRYLLGQVGG